VGAAQEPQNLTVSCLILVPEPIELSVEQGVPLGNLVDLVPEPLHQGAELCPRPIEALIHRIEPPVHRIEPPVHRIEPPVHRLEPPADLDEALVHEHELAADLVEALGQKGSELRIHRPIAITLPVYLQDVSKIRRSR